MRSASIRTAVLMLAIGCLVIAPALAQTPVTVQSPTFEWTGKSGQQAGYRWTATIDNPSKRELRVRVTLEMLDGAGAVVASDSTELTLAKQDQASVDRNASVEVTTAQQATQYRVVLMGIDD